MVQNMICEQILRRDNERIVSFAKKDANGKIIQVVEYKDNGANDWQFSPGREYNIEIVLVKENWE